MRSFLKPGVLSRLKRSIPILLGYIPVAIAFAILALNAGFSPLLTIDLLQIRVEELIRRKYSLEG